MPTRSPTEKPDIVIRGMELEDLPAVFKLGNALFTPERWPTLYRTWDSHELAELYASDDDTCFVAEHGDDLIGFALGTVLEKRKSSWKYGYLLWLGVDPSRGRRGVGKRLLARITDAFVEMGARMILIDTDPTNSSAMRFFRNEGFGHEQPHVYLAKNLTRDPAYQRKKKAKRCVDAKSRAAVKGAGGSGLAIAAPAAPAHEE